MDARILFRALALSFLAGCGGDGEASPAGPRVLSFAEGRMVVTDLGSGQSQSVPHGGCVRAFTSTTVYVDNCSTFSTIRQISLETGEVEEEVSVPVQIKAMVAGPDEQRLYVATQDCPGERTCSFPTGVEAYRLPDLVPIIGEGASVPGTVFNMFFHSSTLVIVSTPGGVERFFLTLLERTGEGEQQVKTHEIPGSVDNFLFESLTVIGRCPSCPLPPP